MFTIAADFLLPVGHSRASRVIREGINDLTYYPDDPRPRFMVICFNTSALPYMTALFRINSEAASTAEGNTRLNAALDDGTIPTPPVGGRLYLLSGPDRERSRLLAVVWLPNATAESTGLSTERSDGTWLMCEGTRRAHIMIGDIPYGQDEALWEMCVR